jgi:prepilin signal peptidase PulO-like enzyme (type II secretory pathway)
MPPPLAPALSVFAVLSGVLALVDVRDRRLPDAVVLPGGAVVILLLSIAAAAVHEPSRSVGVVLGAAGAFLVCLAIHLARPADFGGGDVKLAGVCGAVLGWEGTGGVASGLCVGFVAGGIAAVGAVLAGARRMPLPFGPFLLFGTWWQVLARST